MFKDLEDVVQAVRRIKKEDNVYVNLLIGAGCSVSGNIPTADGIVDIIKNDYSRLYESAPSKNYSECMAQLTPIERRNLISKLVEGSKVNWAHIGIAQLLKFGFIDRILTTNFDNLVLRACSLVGEFPSIYDLASTKIFRPEMVFEKSVLHLHGQHTGFILCNTKEETSEQKQNLKSLFDEIKKNSLWIIVGYSGDNDALVNFLTEEDSFEHRLFWVGYNDEEPKDFLKNELLDSDKYSFFIKGYNADDFFVKLARRLNHFPPSFVMEPFSYLNKTLDNLSDYKLSDSILSSDLNNATRNIINEAVKNIENNKIIKANHYLTIGLEEEFLKLLEKCEKSEVKEIKEVIDTKTSEKLYKKLETLNNKLEKNNSDINLLIKHAETTRFLSIVETDKKEYFLLEATNKYKLAHDLDPEDTDILISWGSVLNKLSNLTDKDLKKVEYNEKVCDKFKKAYLLSPDNKEVNMLYGISLLSLGESKYIFNNKLDNIMYDDLIKIYNNAKKIFSELHESYPKDNEIVFYLGLTLEEQTNLYNINEDRECIIILLEEAIEKFDMAYKLNKSDIKSLVNYYESLIELSNIYENINDKKEILELSISQLNASIKENPKNIEILILCARSLNSLARIEEINQLELFNKGFEKIKKAYEINEKNLFIIQNMGNEVLKYIKFINKNNLEINNEIIEQYFLWIEEIIDNYEEIQEERFINFIIDINGISYDLILNEEYKVSKKLLDLIIEFKELTFFPAATLGLWYFRNKKIELSKSKEFGIKYYEEAIQISENTDTPDFYKNALNQKYYYELTLFNHKREVNKEETINNCLKAYKYGSINRYGSLFNKIKKLINDLQYKELNEKINNFD